MLEIPLNNGTLFNPTVTAVDEFGSTTGYDFLTLDTGFPETHGGNAPTYELSYQASDGLITTHEPFWRGVDIYEEMSFLGEVETEHDFADLTGANWPVDADFPCREYVSQIDTQGTDYKIEYRPFQSETGGTYTYFPNVDWAPWPGERTLDEPEFPFRVTGSDVERLLIRFTIAGGRTQGKLKAAQFKVEGIKKTHREILEVATTGTLVDLTGKGFRKIISVSITPALTGSTIGTAGVTGQAYDLLAKQQPGGAGTTYELSGPQVALSDEAGGASVTIEGY